MGHAFIHFYSNSAAVHAKGKMEKMVLEGRTMHVEWALPREKEKDQEKKKELLKSKNISNNSSCGSNNDNSNENEVMTRRSRREGKTNKYELENQCFCGCIQCLGPSGPLCGCGCMCKCNGSREDDPYVGMQEYCCFYFYIIIVFIHFRICLLRPL
jgi:hypothetical protein